MADAIAIVAPMAATARTASATLVRLWSKVASPSATRLRPRPKVASPAESAESVAAAEPAPLFENLSPAGLAAQAELNEAAAESGAARRPRRPRRPRVSADQVDGGSDNANSGANSGADAGEVAAAPADSGNAEPVDVDIDN